MLAMALAVSFNMVLESWAIPVQRGFIGSRVMLQNVLDIESYSIAYARIYDEAATIYLDFAAAFPSLARAFIWKALISLRIPFNI
eukprot:12254474-Karenia_brevis.AAC.1